MHVRDYWALTKPRVVALIVFTALVGMFPVSYTHLDVYKRQCWC